MTNRITEQQVDEVLALDVEADAFIKRMAASKQNLCVAGYVLKVTGECSTCGATNRDTCGRFYETPVAKRAESAPTMAAIIRQQREDARVMREALSEIEQTWVEPGIPASESGRSMWRIAKAARKGVGHE